MQRGFDLLCTRRLRRYLFIQLPFDPVAVVLVLLAMIICALGADTYTNPVIPEIGPADPAVIRHDGKYYMYCTGDNRSYHVYTSYDLVNWSKGSRVFVPGGVNIWAPDIYYNQADQTFYMYYTADWNIGVATCDTPDGIFVDQGVLLNGYIDAHLFRDDDGSLYLYYTNVGTIYVQVMTDLLHLGANRNQVMHPTEPWETAAGSVTEGPWLLKHDGTYYLLYSGSGANTPYYAVGYATASHPMGPWTKYPGNPIISRGDGVYGPGHGCVTTDDAGNLWHVYHQKNTSDVAWDRFICIDPMWFDASGVLHSQATRGAPQPAPYITADFQEMVAHWELNGDYTDSSSAGHDALGYGTPQFVVGADGTAVGAVRVTPSSGWATAGTWNPSDATGDLSISLWLKWSGTNGTWQSFLAKRDGDWSNENVLWQLCTDENGNHLWFQSPRSLVYVDNSLMAGEWHHIVATFDGYTGLIYINGIVRGSGSFEFGDAVDAIITLGGNSGGSAPAREFTNGILDDVRLYNYPISDLEVAQLYTPISGDAVCVESLRPQHDYNGDCVVNLPDFAAFVQRWLYCGLVPDCLP